MKLKIFIPFLFIALSCRQETPLIYKDPSYSADARAHDLLMRMTLEEKVSQLYAYRGTDTLSWDEEGNLITGSDSVVLYHGVASYIHPWMRELANDPVRYAKALNSVQRYMLEKTRLGIPVFVFSEALHGFMARGATCFPQAIALGCTWDTVLIERIFSAIALEARTRGTTQVLSPVLDLARDPRWGRTEECFGEDPCHVSRMALAAIHGLQGRADSVDKYHVAVTLKHFAGHGQPEGGRNTAPVNLPEIEFRESHLYPFEIAVKKGGALSVMASYNEWNGTPNHVNRILLYDILRNEWGFRGFVMSDGGGMDLLMRDHHVAASPDEAGILSIEAGIDYDLGSQGCFRNMTRLVKNGKVSQQALDRAVFSILKVKFLCGLFDDPYSDVELMSKVTNSPEHRHLALTAAHESIVLLKNERNLLPLDSARIKTLAVIGPNAAGIHLGGYSYPPMRGTSVLAGIRALAGNRFKVTYSPGCRLTLNRECHWQVNEPPILNTPENDALLIREAVKTARKADAVVLVLGENELLNREAWSDQHLGDTDDLNLVGRQMDLVRAIMAAGKPVVAVLINGRPLTINELNKTVPAIIEAWYLGQETGHALADVLFGKVNPSGKLSVTFPASVGQLPCYYNHKPSRFRSYALADSEILYPFGHGLSYTTFRYANLRIYPDSISTTARAMVMVEVTNTGKRKGSEIVQLYIRDIISLPVRPVMELRDFARVTLNPGETKTISFYITPKKLEYTEIDMKKRAVQPGDFLVMTGKSSVSYLADTLHVYMENKP